MNKAIENDFPITSGVGSCGGATYNSDGLVCGHAYSIH